MLPFCILVRHAPFSSHARAGSEQECCVIDPCYMLLLLTSGSVENQEHVLAFVSRFLLDMHEHHIADVTEESFSQDVAFLEGS